MKNTQPWQKYPQISKELDQVNDLIHTTIKTPYADLQEALLSMANNGGKYLRPSLLILSAQIASGKQNVSQQIIQLASSVELLHMASLIHDDIVDDSDERRGQISIQARFGKDTAVYAGDLLFTHFFDLILQAIDEHHYMVENAHIMRQILNGELSQMAERFNLDQTLEQYLFNIKGKTAALFRLAAEEGAHFAGNNQEITTTMAKFAEDLGIAFQIVDDILDYNGVELNKPTLEDLATGVYSLPLLLALRQDALRRQLLPLLKKQRQMTAEDMNQVQKIIISSSVLTQSRELAQKYTDAAINELAKLPNSPARKLLIKMTKRVVKRTA